MQEGRVHARMCIRREMELPGDRRDKKRAWYRRDAIDKFNQFQAALYGLVIPSVS